MCEADTLPITQLNAMFEKCELPLKADGVHILPEAMGQLLKSWKAPRFPSRARSHATWELTTEMKADAISERGWPAQPD